MCVVARGKLKCTLWSLAHTVCVCVCVCVCHVHNASSEQGCIQWVSLSSCSSSAQEKQREGEGDWRRAWKLSVCPLRELKGLKVFPGSRSHSASKCDTHCSVRQSFPSHSCTLYMSALSCLDLLWPSLFHPLLFSSAISHTLLALVFLWKAFSWSTQERTCVNTHTLTSNAKRFEFGCLEGADLSRGFYLHVRLQAQQFDAWEECRVHYSVTPGLSLLAHLSGSAGLHHSIADQYGVCSRRIGWRNVIHTGTVTPAKMYRAPVSVVRTSFYHSFLAAYTSGFAALSNAYKNKRDAETARGLFLQRKALKFHALSPSDVSRVSELLSCTGLCLLKLKSVSEL